MLDSSDAMHIVKMDLANLIMKSPPENREVWKTIDSKGKGLETHYVIRLNPTDWL